MDVGSVVGGQVGKLRGRGRGVACVEAWVRLCLGIWGLL